jgi:hypothetical protein
MTWLLAAFLGLGLAASAGLKTFVPLLVLSAAERFHLFGLQLAPAFAWLGSWPALAALALATAAELAADKIPIVDHAVSAVGTLARPAAGALAAAAAFHQLDPGLAALAGLVIGAPTALAFHTAQAGGRVASTATTAGAANPVVSLAEDALAFGTAILALAAPVLVPIALGVIFWLVWRLTHRVRRALGPR